MFGGAAGAEEGDVEERGEGAADEFVLGAAVEEGKDAEGEDPAGGDDAGTGGDACEKIAVVGIVCGEDIERDDADGGGGEGACADEHLHAGKGHEAGVVVDADEGGEGGGGGDDPVEGVFVIIQVVP